MKCPNCGTEVSRSEAKFCTTCGQILFPNILSKAGVGKAFSVVVNVLDNVLGHVEKLLPPLDGDENGQQVSVNDIDPGAPTVMLPPISSHKRLGEKVKGYVVIQKMPLLMQRSCYYKVCMTNNCPYAHLSPNALAEKCSYCQTEHKIYLMHDTRAFQLMLKDRQTLLDVSRKTPGILEHIATFEDEGRQYTVVAWPGEHRTLLQQLVRHDSRWIISACEKLGNTLEQLPAYFQLDPIDLLDAIVVTGYGNQQEIYFSDLTIFFQHTMPSSGPKLPAVSALGQILYTLSSGNPRPMRASAHLYDVPIEFQSLLDKARRDGYNSLQEFIEEIKQALMRPVLLRSLRQMVGYGTDIGKQRDHNEDFVGRYSFAMQQLPDTPEVGLYVVADGMGGHQAGEKASASAVFDVMRKIILERGSALQMVPRLTRATIKLEDTMTPEAILKEAIQEANKYLFQARQGTGSDRGTTITTVLIIGNICVIANVGDSRTYLMRGNQLTQITRDHSLVASLVMAGQIKAEEVRNHPQRNQIYRTMGERANLEVDTFHQVLTVGDQLLLCSDGLWEMVLDSQIERILLQSSSPQAACDQLIETANKEGGNDNVSVVVIRME